MRDTIDKPKPIRLWSCQHLHTARRPAGRPDTEPVLPGQALTARMALEGFTTQAAEAAGLAGRGGRLAPGYAADLVAFGLDPLTAGPDEFAESPVLLTVVDGEVVHRADAPVSP
ncbi:amidohydrolase family protein [Nonomuraea polychroma]|uniref:amidohydrolase family protein n=1 Tax=Nonomuraea polychroma TaxID=46176 RepID=UPI003D8C4E90